MILFAEINLLLLVNSECVISAAVVHWVTKSSLSLRRAFSIGVKWKWSVFAVEGKEGGTNEKYIVL